jgi:uncharacterized protein (TIGR03067 family)
MLFLHPIRGPVLARHLLLGLLIAGATLPGSAAAEPDDANAQNARIQVDRERYAGTWRVMSIESDGSRSDEGNRTIVVENDVDGSWRLSIDGREVSRGTSRIDPLAAPAEIDIQVTEGEAAETVFKGIYEFGENTRRLCFRGAGGWRPREFSAAVGSGSVLVEFRRQ